MIKGMLLYLYSYIFSSRLAGQLLSLSASVFGTLSLFSFDAHLSGTSVFSLHTNKCKPGNVNFTLGRMWHSCLVYKHQIPNHLLLPFWTPRPTPISKPLLLLPLYMSQVYPGPNLARSDQNHVFHQLLSTAWWLPFHSHGIKKIISATVPVLLVVVCQCGCSNVLTRLSGTHTALPFTDAPKAIWVAKGRHCAVQQQDRQRIRRNDRP